MLEYLSNKKILSFDGSTHVIVYDGDVNYQLSETSKNPRYYYDEGGNKFKTRPYSQWTSMYARSTIGSAYQKLYKSYEGVTHSKLFDNFDSWVSWAEKQPFFMCTFEGFLCQLDKDLKGDGRYYSEDFCMFLPPFINSGLKGDIDKIKAKLILSDDNCFSLIEDELMEVLLDTIGNCGLDVNSIDPKYNIYSEEGLLLLGDSAREIIKFSTEVDLFIEVDSNIRKENGYHVCSIILSEKLIKGLGRNKKQSQKDLLCKLKEFLGGEYKKVNLDNNFGKNFSEFFNGVYLNVCRLEKYL